MKKTLRSILKSRIVLLAAAGMITVSINSCTKSSSGGNDAAKFVGTWTGTSTCSSSAASFSFQASSNGSVCTTSGTVGNPGTTGCVKNITVNVTASGNNITISPQTFTDGCGLSYTISGAGSLSGNTLSLTETVSGAVNASCSFTGTK